MDPSLSAHVLTHAGREPAVETRGETSRGDLVRIGMQVRPAMGRAGCRRAGHRHFGNVGRAEHGFPWPGDRRAYDAVGAWIFGMHRRVVDRLPACLAFGGGVAVDIAVADGR